MKIMTPACIVLIAACLCGCTSSRVSQLRQEIEAADSRREAAERDLAGQKEIEQTLRREKQALTEDGAVVRREARSFIKAQMRVLRDFSENKAILDYIGGELVPREHSGGKALLLVDLRNPLPATGILLGGKLLANDKTAVSFCVLRPQEKNLVVVWISELTAISKTGVAIVTFDTPVTVEKGDLIGLYSPGDVLIPFSRGTGDTRSMEGPIKVGQVVPLEALKQDGLRMYSFGVAGLLE